MFPHVLFFSALTLLLLLQEIKPRWSVELCMRQNASRGRDRWSANFAIGVDNGGEVFSDGVGEYWQFVHTLHMPLPKKVQVPTRLPLVGCARQTRE